MITEIGGTVGDIESLPFLEAIRQLYTDARAETGDVRAPDPRPVHRPRRRAEDEADPALGQRAARDRDPAARAVLPLRMAGSTRRSGRRSRSSPASRSTRSSPLTTSTTSTRCPLGYRAEGVDDLVLDHFGLELRPADLSDWEAMVRRADAAATREVRIAIVGKYVQLRDAYKSVIEALEHGGIHHGVEVDIELVDSEHLDRGGARRPSTGSSSPAASASAASRARSRAAQIARERQDPVPGDLPRDADRGGRVRPPRGRDGRRQLLRVRSRDALPGRRPAARTERDRATWAARCASAPTPCALHEGTRAREIFGEASSTSATAIATRSISACGPRLEEEGLVAGGTSPDGRLVEMIELPDHPFYVASQFHPEFNSPPRPARAAVPRVRRRRHRTRGRSSGPTVTSSPSPTATASTSASPAPPPSTASLSPVAGNGGSTTPSSGSARSARRRGRSARWPTRAGGRTAGARAGSDRRRRRRARRSGGGQSARRGGGRARRVRHVLRAYGHGPAPGPDRGRERRRGLPQRRRHDPRRRQQGRRGGLHGAGAARGGAPSAGRDRARPHRRRGAGAARREGLRRRGAARRDRLSSSTMPARSARSSPRRRPSTRSSPTSSGSRRTPGCGRRTVPARSRPPPRRSAG